VRKYRAAAEIAQCHRVPVGQQTAAALGHHDGRLEPLRKLRKGGTGISGRRSATRLNDGQARLTEPRSRLHDEGGVRLGGMGGRGVEQRCISHSLQDIGGQLHRHGARSA